jgi:hypothetical protein
MHTQHSCRLQRVLRFHLGTVAFASLIIAIINFIRAIVLYLQAKAKKDGNFLQRMVLCIAQWCAGATLRAASC